MYTDTVTVQVSPAEPYRRVRPAAITEEHSAAQALLELGRDQDQCADMSAQPQADQCAAPAGKQPPGAEQKMRGRKAGARGRRGRTPQQAQLKGFDPALLPFRECGLVTAGAPAGESLVSRAKIWLTTPSMGVAPKRHLGKASVAASTEKPPKRPRLG